MATMLTHALLLILVAATTMWLVLDRASRRHAAALVLSAVVVVTTIAAAVAYRPTWNPAEFEQIPRRERPNGYVSSNACQSCHPSQYATWHRSYHRTMTQVASPEAIRGDFDDATLESRGLVYHLQRRGSEFWVDMPDPDADFANRDREIYNRITDRDPPLPRTSTRVVLATGSHHMQTYWVPSNDGRALRNLPFLYLFKDRRWVPREDAFLRPPDAGRMMPEWNANCIKCHSTRPYPKLNRSDGTPDTEVLEFGISCEACHGPGEAHVRANTNPWRRYRRRLADTDDPTIVNPAKLPARAATQVCGQCHGAYLLNDPNGFAAAGFTYDAGEDLEQTRYYARHPLNENRPVDKIGFAPSPAFLEHYFWPDGTMRATGREYQSVTESPCHLRGRMSCMSCHSMHDSHPADQLAKGKDGIEACLQCHPQYREKIPEHTHHPAGSVGSDCYNCHMARTSYGLMTAIRSHQVDSPSLSTATEDGRPNACNLCHLDRTLAWTDRFLNEWYGQKTVALTATEQQIAAGVLWVTRGDAAQRAIVSWHMGWAPAQQASGSGWLGPYLAMLLDDPYAAVRYIAYHALRSTPGFADFAYDYIGPAERRKQAVVDAQHFWATRAPHILQRIGDDILIDVEANWQRESVESLLRQRDDRRLYLAE